MNDVKPAPKKLHRISASQVPSEHELLVRAFLTIDAAGRSQRKLFGEFMPELYMFRMRLGMTFKEITTLLADCGLKLSGSSVRVYFWEFVNRYENVYIDQLDQKERIYNELRKETEGAKVSEISAIVSRFLARLEDDKKA